MAQEEDPEIDFLKTQKELEDLIEKNRDAGFNGPKGYATQVLKDVVRELKDEEGPLRRLSRDYNVPLEEIPDYSPQGKALAESKKKTEMSAEHKPQHGSADVNPETTGQPLAPQKTEQTLDPQSEIDQLNAKISELAVGLKKETDDYESDAQILGEMATLMERRDQLRKAVKNDESAIPIDDDLRSVLRANIYTMLTENVEGMDEAGKADRKRWLRENASLINKENGFDSRDVENFRNLYLLELGEAPPDEKNRPENQKQTTSLGENTKGLLRGRINEMKADVESGRRLSREEIKNRKSWLEKNRADVTRANFTQEEVDNFRQLHYGVLGEYPPETPESKSQPTTSTVEDESVVDQVAVEHENDDRTQHAETVQSIKDQIENQGSGPGSLWAKDLDWFAQNEEIVLDPKNGFTNDQIQDFRNAYESARIMSGEALPIVSLPPQDIDQETAVLHSQDTLQGQSVDPDHDVNNASVTVDSEPLMRRDRKWSASYNELKHRRDQIHSQRAWMDNDDDLSVVESELEEMLRVASLHIEKDARFSDTKYGILNAINNFSNLSNAQERAAAVTRIQQQISGLRVVAGAGVDQEIRGAIEEQVNAERDLLRDDLEAARERYETTHEEVLRKLLDKSVDLEDRLASKTPEYQYNQISHILFEVETKDKVPIKAQKQEIKDAIQTIEVWLTDAKTGKEQPLHPEVVDAVRARILLSETHKAILGVNDIGNRDQMGAAMNELKRNGRLAGPKELMLAFGKERNSLLVDQDKVFEFMDRVARGLVTDSAGNVIEWDFEASTSDKRARLVEMGGFSPETGLTAIQMAEIAYYITGEFAVQDRKLRTKMGKLANFTESRGVTQAKKDQGTSTDDPGPLRTRTLVPNLLTSSVRRLSVDGKYVFLNDKWREAISLANSGNHHEAILKYLEICKATPSSASHYLSEENFDLKDAPADFIAAYWSSYVPSCVQASKYLLQSSWRPDEFKSDTIQDIMAAFAACDNTVDKTEVGVLKLRIQFLRGVFSEVMRMGGEATNENIKGWEQITQVNQLLFRLTQSGFISNRDLVAILNSKEENIGGTDFSYDVRAYATNFARYLGLR